ncbi:MAG: hypothetical protein RIR12_2478 [Bacteroidota bacterium]|jgi:hypothetical protein
MKSIVAFFLTLIFFSCKSHKNIPDVTGIKINLPISRFDIRFTAIDTNEVVAELDKLYEQQPEITSIFLHNILGLDSANTTSGVKTFIRLNEKINAQTTAIFKNTDALQKEFEKAFQFVRYYFPTFKIPKNITTIVGPPDAMAQTKTNEPTPNFITDETIGISLQFYLGRDNPLYKEEYFVQNVAPLYRSRRFSKEYICADAMKLVITDLFPDKSGGKPLIEQMVEKGKQWLLLDKLMPNTPDSIKTGYTQQQLDWCTENEGLIWSNLVKNEDLHSLSPSVIQVYIGESPFTQGFPQEVSPGNIGQWIGWQIVKKYAAKNNQLAIEEIMTTPASKILDEAKYKPK